MQKIHDFDLHKIESETKLVLYWMADTAQSLKEGNARLAHLSLTTALQHLVELAIQQKTLFIENNHKPVDIDYQTVYATALEKAKAELEQELKNK